MFPRKAMNLRLSLLAALLAALVSACAEPARDGPTSTDMVGAQLHRRLLVERPEPLRRHVLEGRVYYLALAPCCDRHDYLYNAQGEYICAPSGGFSGSGDGKCPRLRQALRQSTGELVPNPFYKP